MFDAACTELRLPLLYVSGRQTYVSGMHTFSLQSHTDECVAERGSVSDMELLSQRSLQGLLQKRRSDVADLSLSQLANLFELLSDIGKSKQQ